jgi:hypothetical protein
MRSQGLMRAAPAPAGDLDPASQILESCSSAGLRTSGAEPTGQPLLLLNQNLLFFLIFPLVMINPDERKVLMRSRGTALISAQLVRAHAAMKSDEKSHVES